MAKYETNSLGYKLSINGPDTVEDYDKAAGRVGACLEDATDNTIYRGTLPEWQEKFGTEVLVPKYGERQVNTAATEAARARSKTPDKVGDVMETWSRYHARVTAGLSKEDKTALQAEAQRIADTITVDPSPSKRQAGPPKPFLAKADSLLTLDDATLSSKLDKMAAVVPDFDLERDESTGKPDRTSLARMIEAWTDASL